MEGTEATNITEAPVVSRADQLENILDDAPIFLKGGATAISVAGKAVSSLAKKANANKVAKVADKASSVASTAALIGTNVLATVGTISVAILRNDIRAVMKELNLLIVGNQMLSRGVAQFKQTLLAVDSVLMQVAEIGDDDFRALKNLQSHLEAGKSLILEIAKARKRVFGYFLSSPYDSRIQFLRKQILEDIHILTLAYVISNSQSNAVSTNTTNTTTNNFTITNTNTEILHANPSSFDATLFLTHNETKRFWAQHIGKENRKICWYDFIECFEYEFGSLEAYLLYYLKKTLVNNREEVTVYAFRKFTADGSVHSSFLTLQHVLLYYLEARWSIFGSFVSEMDEFVKETTNALNANEIVISLQQDSGIKRNSNDYSLTEYTTDPFVKLAYDLNSFLTNRESFLSNNTNDNSNNENNIYLQILITKIKAKLQETCFKRFTNNKIKGRNKTMIARHVMEYLIISEFLTNPSSSHLPATIKTKINQTRSNALPLGVAAFNGGFHDRCYNIYYNAVMEIISDDSKHECSQSCFHSSCLVEPHPLLQPLFIALDHLKLADSPTTKAWLLRDALDFYHCCGLLQE